MPGEEGYGKGRDGKPVALERRQAANDGRRYSPSTARNRDPILETFRAFVGRSGNVLEIASGTGEHGAHITDHLSGFNWTYSDIDEDGLRSQAAWRAVASHGRLHGPLLLNAMDDDWGEAERPGEWDVIVCINMIHIAPIEALQGVVKGAGRLLGPHGRLFFYGPFAMNGEIAPSNAAFDESLKARNPAWGVRDLMLDVLPLVDTAGLKADGIAEMPANNKCVVFTRA